MIISRTPRRLAACAVAAGTAAWLFYLREQLVLSHYDAKAHLVVARRVIDSLTPGWEQIGAVWLPLPHLINLLPTQIDLFYRTGAFASAVSIACFGITTWAAARLVLAATGSRAGAVTSAALLVLNPDLLYLHVTPMTEPLLLAATFVGVLWLYEWIGADQAGPPPPSPSEAGEPRRRASARVEPPGLGRPPAKLGWILFAAAWTRYEAWLVIGTAICATAIALWRASLPAAVVLKRLWQLTLWPAAAGLLFLVNSRLTVGAWLVTGGFYERDPLYDGRLWQSLIAVWWGTHQLSGYVIEITALATAALLVALAIGRSGHAAALIPVSLLAAAALPFYAMYDGHPFRIRYMVPVVAACAVLCGMAVGYAERIGWLRRSGTAADGTRPSRVVGLAMAGLLIGSTLIASPPWDEHSPLLAEAQWDVPVSLNRREVTACLAPGYRGERIVASMASLAHYMQELSHEGFAIADFIHEGNGAIWNGALERGAASHAGWMLVEEESEGGDTLARRIRRDPAFTRGMTRICEGGGVALYKRE